MKLLTVTVPCYNSQDYMEKCIESLLRGGERVEIIVINDGSKDATGEIGDRYAIPVPGVEPLDDQLARVIAELKADPAHRARMAQAGIERAKKFSRQSYYRNFLAALHSARLEDDVL